MPADGASKSAFPGRRRFLLTTGAAAAASVAMPQVSRAQTVTWKMQSAWASRDIFHEFALDYAKRVSEMTGGRLRLDMQATGAVVPPFQLADAVHTGILDGGHGLAVSAQNKHKAYALFGNPPPFGWDSHGFLGWFYEGGGEPLYRTLVNEILKLNLVGFLSFPMPTQPLGWFRREVTRAADFKGLKYRTTGLSADVFRHIGAAVVLLPEGEIVVTMERGLLDAAEVANPSSDIALGLPESAKVYMLGSHHRHASAFEVIFNKTKFDALPPEYKAILRNAAFAASTANLGAAYFRYAKDLDAIGKRGVRVVRTGDAVLRAELEAWDRLLAVWSKEPFFAKVVASQAAWVKRTVPFLQSNNLDSAALQAAYRHFFG
jgi:TRAP-type mannitol/chloroaromatic compound transport system substrate-binding protein